MNKPFQKKDILAICFVAGILLFMMVQSLSAAENADFAAFKKQQTQGANDLTVEFQAYKKALEKDFSLYVKVYKAAFEARKKKISEVWGDYRPGDKTHWVEYDKNGVRKSVNFESGDVELEMLVDKRTAQKQVEAALKKRILALLLTSKREAFNRDDIAQAVEKKMANKPTVKAAEVPDTPLLSNLVPELKSDNLEKITRISKKFEKQAIIDVRAAKKKNKKVVRMKFKIPTDAPRKSKEFLHRARKIADKEKIPLTLIMGVMETESAFNPMAKSGVPAYGLMQIVPRSAGKDATGYLFGKPKVLSPSYLYNPDKNIEIGGAYLHILYFRYLKKIKDPVSRLYCAIAAYNTGAGNVAKAFSGKTNINKAAIKINRLTPKQVYQKLRRDLPYKETQHYVKRVSTNMVKYQ